MQWVSRSERSNLLRLCHKDPFLVVLWWPSWLRGTKKHLASVLFSLTLQKTSVAFPVVIKMTLNYARLIHVQFDPETEIWHQHMTVFAAPAQIIKDAGRETMRTNHPRVWQWWTPNGHDKWQSKDKNVDCVNCFNNWCCQRSSHDCLMFGACLHFSTI